MLCFASGINKHKRIFFCQQYVVKLRKSLFQILCFYVLRVKYDIFNIVLTYVALKNLLCINFMFILINKCYFYTFNILVNIKIDNNAGIIMIFYIYTNITPNFAAQVCLIQSATYQRF